MILDLRKTLGIPHNLKELINDDTKFELMMKWHLMIHQQAQTQLV